MIRVVGLETGKIYVQGKENDCFRYLQKKYPYKTARKRTLTNDAVYPEPLMVVGK